MAFPLHWRWRIGWLKGNTLLPTSFTPTLSVKHANVISHILLIKGFNPVSRNTEMTASCLLLEGGEGVTRLFNVSNSVILFISASINPVFPFLKTKCLTMVLKVQRLCSCTCLFHLLYWLLDCGFLPALFGFMCRRCAAAPLAWLLSDSLPHRPFVPPVFFFFFLQLNQ